VRWPNATRLGRIGIASGRGRPLNTGTALPRQAREQATRLAKGDGPFASPERPNPFFVEDGECRQADVGDFLLTESEFVTRSSVLRQPQAPMFETILSDSVVGAAAIRAAARGLFPSRRSQAGSLELINENGGGLGVR
jgi:hypothetical protein